jgi:hypothetical protein
VKGVHDKAVIDSTKNSEFIFRPGRNLAFQQCGEKKSSLVVKSDRILAAETRFCHGKKINVSNVKVFYHFLPLFTINVEKIYFSSPLSFDTQLASISNSEKDS